MEIDDHDNSSFRRFDQRSLAVNLPTISRQPRSIPMGYLLLPVSAKHMARGHGSEALSQSTDDTVSFTDHTFCMCELGACLEVHMTRPGDVWSGRWDLSIE